MSTHENRVQPTDDENRNRRRLRTRKLTLLNRLVRAPWFQFLVGNVHWRHLRRPNDLGSETKYVFARQSVFEKFFDLLTFVFMVLISPLFAIKNRLAQSYWIKFALGVVCGISCLVVIYKVVDTLLFGFPLI